MRTGDERPTASSVAGAIRWAVGGSNRPTSSFVTCGSSVRVPGGMRSTATRCWHCAVPSITGPSIRCLRVINSGYGKRKNHRMLPIDYFGNSEGVVVNHNPLDEEKNSVDLTGVTHEVGHALGFTHSRREGSAEQYEDL